jgi:hypothetical protein
MESLASVASSSNLAQNVQPLEQVLAIEDQLEQDRVAFEQQQMHQGIDRSMRNRMSDEIVSILSDAMSIMKKTGEEARNSGR